MIEVKNLTKKYGSFYAVHDISFTVEKGHIYGFLGPNGAGKSTTMNIISGCLAATDGEVKINGYDIFEDAVKAKRNIGYLPENPPLYGDMTPREYLRFVGRAKGVKKDEIDAELEAVMNKTGICNVADRLIKNLSKGYKQRVGIAQAILGNPEFIILDEPTVGLDPLQLIGVRELIIALKKDHGVILSSHIMGEIESVCDYVTMIYGGRIVASDSYESLERDYAGTVCFKVASDKETVEEMLNKIDGITYSRVSENGRYIKAVIEGNNPDSLVDRVTGCFAENSIEVLSVDRNFSLEDCFVKLMESFSPEEPEKKEKKTEFKKDTNPLAGAYFEEVEITEDEPGEQEEVEGGDEE